MDINKGINFIWENARLLERAVFEYRFYEGSASRVVHILKTYQNADGGFGNALEPDLRAPDSHPLFVEFGLRTLHDCGLRDPETTHQVCDFLARHADLKKGIPMVFPSFTRYPHADHMNAPSVTQQAMDRLIGLVGLASWQGVHHPWLAQAVEVCLERISSIPFTDAHTILTAFGLLESLSIERDVEPLFQKLSGDLMNCQFFCPGTPVEGYCLTPIDFAPTPESYCRRIFSQTQIEAHLSDLESKQAADGGWPIDWVPPGEAAQWEWRAYKTVFVLNVLKAYGRV